MPTKLPRLNIALDEELYRFISMLAHKGKKSMSVVAKELIHDAAELHEDYLLSELAMKRETESKKTVKHEDAWK